MLFYFTGSAVSGAVLFDQLLRLYQLAVLSVMLRVISA